MLNTPVRKIINPTEYFSKINIPDDWDSIEEFVDWYIDARMPLMVPWSAPVIRTDDATAICVFRKGNYQVELYLEYPKEYVQRHGHPRMKSVIIDFGGGLINPSSEHPTGVSTTWGQIFKTIQDSDEHGGDITPSFGNGSCFLACQRWENVDEMTSAAIQWKGITAGPLQEELIRKSFAKRNLSVQVDSGYADVSEPKTIHT
jgi:hypothetical protein